MKRELLRKSHCLSNLCFVAIIQQVGVSRNMNAVKRGINNLLCPFLLLSVECVRAITEVDSVL